MHRHSGKPPELAIPVASLAALRRALAEEAGADTAARALAAAGHAAGTALFSQLSPDDISAVSEASYWRKLSQMLRARGWGTLVHSEVHHGVGALTATDWVEADEEAQANRPSCHFTTGMLANLLGNTARSPVTVLEVECRSRGDAHCRFLFGSEEALQNLYHGVLNGASTETALAEL
jgi:predicted hydrocarbon binding protein